jgi:hypothetical protein
VAVYFQKTQLLLVGWEWSIVSCRHQSSCHWNWRVLGIWNTWPKHPHNPQNNIWSIECIRWKWSWLSRPLFHSVWKEDGMCKASSFLRLKVQDANDGYIYPSVQSYKKEQIFGSEEKYLYRFTCLKLCLHVPKN